MHIQNDNNENQTLLKKYNEMKKSFDEYKEKMIQKKIKKIVIDINCQNNEGHILFGSHDYFVENNCYNVVKKFINEIIKENKSYLLKKHDLLSFDKVNNIINLSFAHLEDIADIVNFLFCVKTDNCNLMITDLKDSLTSLIDKQNMKELYI